MVLARLRRLFSRLLTKQSQRFDYMATNTFALNSIVKAFLKNFQNFRLATQKTLTILFSMCGSYVFAQTTLGPYALQSRDNNPLREPIDFLYRPTPVVVDWDKDGDMDIAVADFDGGNGFHYLKNVGTNAQPKFIKWRGVGNPFYFTAYDDGATQAFSDIDKDGDWDMLLGIIDGTFRFYKNTNPTNAVPLSAQTGAWNSTTKTGNPFFGVDLGDYASPFFIDLDNDADDDLVIGTSYGTLLKSIYYYVNDGTGTFTQGDLTGINPNAEAVTPIFIDVDNDGNLDILTGEGSGIIRFFKRTGTTSFEEQTGTSNPFNGIDKGEHASPTAADFDNDGDKDLVVAWQGSTPDLSYYENKGNGVFEEKLRFDNPFDGFDAGSSASPFFTDVDNDGDSDLILGDRSGSGGTKVYYYRNDSGVFSDKTSESPFVGLTIPNALTPSFIDFDGDGDKDLLGGVDNGTHGSVVYFKNIEGVLVEQLSVNPFVTITTTDETKTDFVDIDDDGDFDLFLSDRRGDFYDQHYFIRYFKNTGTKESPVFTELIGTENPLTQVDEQHVIYPRFTDIDNDGDLDAIVGEAGGVVENEDGNEFSFYENTGTKSNPVFTYRDDLIQQGTNPPSPSPSFVDYDNDGDKDVFIGDVFGYMSFYKNNNAAAVASINANPLNVSGHSVLVDETLTITDADNDMIVEAFVSLSNVDGSELLTFTPVAGISGSFNAGAIHFQGAATAATYQSLLRTLTLEVSQGSSTGRSRTAENATISRTISIRVVDSDGTGSTSASRVINFVDNEAPVFADNAASLNVGSSITIDLKTLVSDANANINFASFIVSSQPSSGAATSIDANGILTIDYANVNFAGIESLTVQVSDTDGASDISVITITVINTAPVITPIPLTTPHRSTKVINLLDITTDADDNLELTSFQVVGSTTSGASAAVAMVSSTQVDLTLDYTGTTFRGTDEITIRACDKIGSCTESVISIVVEEPSSIEIYNAVAPNSSGDNKFFRIQNLPATNTVTLFNRWGDVVYKISGYDNETPGKRFEGVGNNGSALPTGTYFYRIEYDNQEGSKTLTGYLALKQ
jgi:gliding motility-associated-like protein